MIYPFISHQWFPSLRKIIKDLLSPDRISMDVYLVLEISTLIIIGCIGLVLHDFLITLELHKLEAMSHTNYPLLFQIIAGPLISTKPLPEPMMYLFSSVLDDNPDCHGNNEHKHMVTVEHEDIDGFMLNRYNSITTLMEALSVTYFMSQHINLAVISFVTYHTKTVSVYTVQTVSVRHFISCNTKVTKKVCTE